VQNAHYESSKKAVPYTPTPTRPLILSEWLGYLSAAHFERMPLLALGRPHSANNCSGAYYLHRPKEKAASGGLVSSMVPAL